jgi:hypothetical protein
MRTLTLGLLLVFLAVPLSAAPEVDDNLLSSQSVNPELAIPLSADMLAKMAAVEQRREAFARDFDWGTPEEYTQQQKIYSEGLDAFARRTAELKLEWNRSIGNDAEADRIAEQLREMNSERRGVDLNLERCLPEKGTVQQDGGQR